MIRETISFCLVYLIASVTMILKKQWLPSYLILMFRWQQMILRLAIGLGSQIKINQRKQLSTLWTGSTVGKPVSSKIFANENLTFKNETLAFYGRKLKYEGHNFFSCTRNGLVFIKKSERSKPIKIPSLKTYDSFQDFSVKMKKLMQKDLLFKILKFGKIFVLILVKL